jgi:hypothetical protein
MVNIHSQALPKATTLSFEFYREEDGAGASSGGAAGAGSSGAGKVTITVPHVDRLQESDHEILRELVKLFNVPEQHRWVPLFRPLSGMVI